MYKNREIYANAPLELVAAEIRFPYTSRLRQQELLDSIATDLNDIAPIARPGQSLTVDFALTGGTVNQQTEPLFKLLDKESWLAITITPTALTVETTRYSEFDDFLRTVLTALEATLRYGNISVVERVGLRYIDEVRVPVAIEGFHDWEGWISPKLLNITSVNGEYPVVTSQGAVQYAINDEMGLLFRFASLVGEGVVRREPLKRRTAPAIGPFFVIDSDGFWQPTTFRDLDVQHVAEVLTQLHSPIGHTFQEAITDKLRAHLRGTNG
jgi:uncharacterized protein (TIGR04255 family)